MSLQHCSAIIAVFLPVILVCISVARCDAPEQKQNLPCGVLKKDKQTAEDKQKELAEKIKQQQEKLEALQVAHPALSASSLTLILCISS